MKEHFHVKGTVEIWNKEKTRLYKKYDNAFLNTGQNAFMNFLKGNFIIDGYKYLAIGDGSSNTNLDMTKLENELFRKEFSSVSVVDNTKLVLDTIIEAEEANFAGQWQELGLIMGGTAWEISSGVLFNRVKVFEKKDNRTAITVSWTIEIITNSNE